MVNGRRKFRPPPQDLLSDGVRRGLVVNMFLARVLQKFFVVIGCCWCDRRSCELSVLHEFREKSIP